MKRIASVVLLLFFLIGNSYAALTINYCCGKIKSVTTVAKAKACGMCGKTAAKGCCNSTQKLLKADDFSKSQSNWNFKAFDATLPAFNIIYSAYKLISFSDFSPLTIESIPMGKVSIIVLISSFII